MRLETDYLGMELRTPLVASPSPLTSRLDSLLRLEDAGVGAVVLPSLFEEDVESEEMGLADRMEAGAGAFSEAVDFFPDVDLGHLSLDRHILLVAEAVERLDVPVIASLNGRSGGGWVRYAQELVEAGAQAIELNMYDVVADSTLSGSAVEQNYLALIADVRAHVDVPIAVKLSPYFTSLANFAALAQGTGADGLVLFNRFYQPDLDLETLDVTPRLELSRPGEMRLPLRWIALLRPQFPELSMALTSGVSSGADVAKGLLAGADVVMTTSEVLRHGPQRAAELLDELGSWMSAHEYESVGQLKGSVAHHSVPDPSAFERAQYQRVLSAWRG